MRSKKADAGPRLSPSLSRGPQHADPLEVGRYLAMESAIKH